MVECGRSGDSEGCMKRSTCSGMLNNVEPTFDGGRSGGFADGGWLIAFKGVGTEGLEASDSIWLY